MRSISWILALGLLASATAAPAAVLCSKKSGVVFLRTDACKKKETAIDPVALGLQGPQGIQGSQGVQGQQGPSAISANVAADGTIVGQSGGVGVTPLAATPGAYVVTTGTNVVGRVILLDTWATTSDGANRGSVTYLMCGTTAPAIDCTSLSVPNDGKTIIVVTTATDNSTATPHGFNLAIL
jgi:hypothetical protein